MVAHTLLLIEPSICAKSKHVIVGKASAAERSSQDLILLWRRVKTKAICTFDFHLHTVHTSCEYVKQLRRTLQPSVALLSLPGLKAEVSWSKIR